LLQVKQSGRLSSRTFATHADNSASAAGSSAKLAKEVKIQHLFYLHYQSCVQLGHAADLILQTCHLWLCQLTMYI